MLFHSIYRFIVSSALFKKRAKPYILLLPAAVLRLKTLQTCMHRFLSCIDYNWYQSMIASTFDSLLKFIFHEVKIVWLGLGSIFVYCCPSMCRSIDQSQCLIRRQHYNIASGYMHRPNRKVALTVMLCKFLS